MLRMLIVRMAYQKSDYASVLLDPIFDWLEDHFSQFHSLSDVDSFKVLFAAGLLKKLDT